MKRQINWDLISCFLFLVLVPAGIIVASNYELYLDTFWRMVSVGLMAITLFASARTSWQGNEPDNPVRQFAMVMHAALAIALYANVVAHVTMRRDISAATLSVAEKHTEEDRQLGMDKERHRMEVESAQQNAKVIEQTRKVLVQTPMESRKTVSERLMSFIKPAPSASASPQMAAQAAPKAEIRTPAQVREAMSFTLLVFLMIEAGLAIVGTVIMTIVRDWDADGNGLPDMYERLARYLPEPEFRRAYPMPYQRWSTSLYPKVQPTTT